jgi:hypothetical protein
MKRMLAALAAVTLTAGLSLAAVAGPATADDTSTPTPAATSTATPTDTSTDTTTPSATPTTTPSATPTATPSATPSATPTATPTTAPSTTDPATTTDPAPAVAPITFAAAATTSSFTADNTKAKSYITVVWALSSWDSSTNATWPQTYVSQTAETTETLDVPLPPTCGTQYQVDSYVVTRDDSVALYKFLAAAKAGTKLTEEADSSFLAPGGWDTAYKLVQNAACPPPCVADSQVSYTYDSATNSGVITVPTIQGSSDTLCQPFYVTATSWKYTTNSVWPQVVDQVDHVVGTTGNANDPISASGTYDYAATVHCGQGDIYASFTSTDATLFPENDGLPGTGYLDGPGNPLAEHFLHQMGFTGPNPTYVQQNTDCYTSTLTPVEPAVTTNQQCNIPGTITIPTTTGVVYYLGSDKTTALTPGQVITGAGNYTIVADTVSGYTFTGGSTQKVWTEHLGDKVECAVSVTTRGCSAVTGVSLVPVWVKFDNSASSTSSTFDVTVTGTSYDTTFTVAGNTTEQENIGTSGIAGETINVLINKVGPATVLTVPPFTNCFTTTVIPADPTVTQATCNVDRGTANNNASLTVDLETGLTYSVTGPAGFTALTGLTGTTGLTVVATGIPAGTYVVTVAALPGFTLDPSITSPTWPFTVNVVTPTCVPISAQGIAADCPDQDGSTGFVTATTGVPNITVSLNPYVVYTATATGSTTSIVLTQAIADVAPGTYTVAVTLSAAGIAAGYVIPVGDTSFGPFVLTAFCPPTEASWHVGATGTDAVCKDGTTTPGAIALTHYSSETGKVTYTVTNTVTNAVIYSGNLQDSVDVPAGSYNVHATVPAGDGISGHIGGNDFEDIAIVIGSSTTGCDPVIGNLAFTGGTIAWFGFVLSGGMLFLGIAFLLLRRRGNRAAE